MGKVQDHKRSAKAKRQLSFGDEAKSRREDEIEFEGLVLESLPNTMFRVQITASQAPQLVDRVMLGTLAGKMRLYRIRVLPGDQVRGYVSKYDLEKCKITFRSNKSASQ